LSEREKTTCQPVAHDTHPLVVAQARLVKHWVFGNGMKVLGGVPNLFGAHEVSLAEALLCAGNYLLGAALSFHPRAWPMQDASPAIAHP
jgi:hypothetical protein